VSSTRGRVIPKIIIRMVPTAVWQGMLQYKDMGRESDSRGYNLKGAPTVSLARSRRVAEG
jgi:hypothetical protein